MLMLCTKPAALHGVSAKCQPHSPIRGRHLPGRGGEVRSLPYWALYLLHALALAGHPPDPTCPSAAHARSSPLRAPRTVGLASLPLPVRPGTAGLRSPAEPSDGRARTRCSVETDEKSVCENKPPRSTGAIQGPLHGSSSAHAVLSSARPFEFLGTKALRAIPCALRASATAPRGAAATSRPWSRAQQKNAVAAFAGGGARPERSCPRGPAVRRSIPYAPAAEPSGSRVPTALARRPSRWVRRSACLAPSPEARSRAPEARPRAPG